MLREISAFFASPEDMDPVFVRLVRNILISTLLATVLAVILAEAAASSRAPSLVVSVLVAAGLLESLALLLVIFRGSLTMAKVVVPPTLVVTVTIIALSTNTIHDISVVAYPVIIILATLLQGRRSLVVTIPLTLGAFALLGILDITGLSKSPLKDQTGIEDILVGLFLIFVSAWTLKILIERMRAARAKAELMEQRQTDANRSLRNLQISLEERVDQRTAELLQHQAQLETANRQVQRRATQLEALAQVMATITSVRDLQQLLPQIASVVGDKFGFYHVGVFLLDEANQYAVLSATNSPGGERMLERHHRLRVGSEGIVGYVTSTGEPRVAMDVGKDSAYFDNPDLPETHSEMALPLRSEGRVVGALDVQSQEVGAFTSEDIKMLTLLADQVGLAIENARLFDETRMALAEAEAVSRQFIREAWARLPTEHGLTGYRYGIAGASPLSEPADAADLGRRPGQEQPPDVFRVVVPIELRGESIGTLVVQSPTPDPLSQEELELIKAVAERVALSAENARLFEETSRRAVRERTVSDITGKIRSMNDPQAMLQTAVEELRKALGATRVEVIPQSVRGAK